MATHAPSRLKARFVLAALFLMLCSGCTTASESGGTTTYRYTVVIPLVTVLVGLGIGGWGFMKLKNGDDDDEGGGKGQGILYLLGGAFVVLFVAPAFAVPYVAVAADKTTIGGSMIWFIPSSTVIDYARVNSVRTEVTERWTRRGKRKSETLVISYSDGKTERMSQGPLIDAALPKMVSAIESHGRNGGNAVGGAFGGPAPGNMMQPAAMPMPGMPMPGMPMPGNPNPSPTVNPTNTVQQSQANPPGQPVQDASQLVVGMVVSGQAKDGAWYGSRIVEILPNGTAKIHYDGYPDSFDEAVPLSRIRITAGGASPIGGMPPTGIPVAGTIPMPPPGFPMPPAGFPNPPTGVPMRPAGFPGVPPGISLPPNTVEATSSNVKQGQTAKALWGATWYSVKILEVKPGNQVKIHYEGYADGFDEVVPLSKIRVSK